MIWENASQRFRLITRAVLYTLLTIALFSVAILFIFSVNPEIEKKEIIDPGMGPLLIKNHRIAVDSLIEKNEYKYIHDAFVLGKISKEDLLVRLRIVQKEEQIAKILEIVTKAGLSIFWKETGQNKNYRIFYAKVDSTISSIVECKELYNFDNTTLESARLVIEKVGFSNKDETFTAIERILN